MRALLLTLLLGCAADDELVDAAPIYQHPDAAQVTAIEIGVDPTRLADAPACDAEGTEG